MKKILMVILPLVILTFAVAPANAQSINSVKRVQATIGNPVSLTGEGKLVARGEGTFHYQVEEGNVAVSGRGVVAVKNEENIDVHGFGKKAEIGEWTYYSGKGNLEVEAENTAIHGWGNFITRARGEGKVTFRGKWNIIFDGLIEAATHLEQILLPVQFQAEVKAQI